MLTKAPVGNGPPPTQQSRRTGAPNDDMRLAAHNLAVIIGNCGVSQSELSRLSGVSRQLINGWARERVSITLSTTIAQLLTPLGFKLSDLLLEKTALLSKMGPQHESGREPSIAIPHLMGSMTNPVSRRRVEALHGAFLYRTRIKETAYLIIEVTFEFDAHSDTIPTVRVHEGKGINSKAIIAGHYFHHESTFYIFAHHLSPPHFTFVYAFWDPMSDRLDRLRGVSLAPEWFGEHRGKPIARLVFMHRVNSDGRPLPDQDFDPDAEFVEYIPADGVSVIKSF